MVQISFSGIWNRIPQSRDLGDRSWTDVSENPTLLFPFRTVFYNQEQYFIGTNLTFQIEKQAQKARQHSKHRFKFIYWFSMIFEILFIPDAKNRPWFLVKSLQKSVPARSQLWTPYSVIQIRDSARAAGFSMLFRFLEAHRYFSWK